MRFMEIILQIYEIIFNFALKLIFIMRKLLLVIGCCLWAVAISAQPIRDEIGRNTRYSAGIYMTYPGPIQQKLTPPPEGMKPFYISHYGRHGSRYQSRQKIYDAPYSILEAADRIHVLTPLGRDVLKRLDVIRRDAADRWGELTSVGAMQQRQIITRMVSRFPEVFDKECTVDARSTTMTRSLLSMENALVQLSALKPDVKIHHNATARDMPFLNQQDEDLFLLSEDSVTRAIYDAYVHKTVHPERLVASLIKDENFVRNHVDVYDFNNDLFRIASSIQNTDLSQQLTLYDLFTDDEIFDNWRVGNARWYITHGGFPLNGGGQPYSQRNLLRKIIAQADSCVRQPNPNVHLRYGHATVIMPLVCLLELDGYGLSTDNLDDLDRKQWADFRIFPMSANIQFVFYRRQPDDSDVLFKVLLNENEATLPLKSSMEPYYRWSDFKVYFLDKLEAYEGKRNEK